MVLRLALLAWLAWLAAAGPLPWDSSKCAQKCNGGIKYQYSEQTSYIYSFESENILEADGASDLSTSMKATVKLTSVSKCEMVLQITDVSTKHGPLEATSSSFIDELQRHPLPFSWDDGRIEHICPNPEDSDDVNNVKRAILSSFQNTMKSFDVNIYDREVDVLGSCDTEYYVKSNENDQYRFLKSKNIKTCSNHLKAKSVLLASFYESSSHRQHLPFLTGESLTCEQSIEAGIVKKVACEERASFKPLYEYGYVVNARGTLSLTKLSSEPASAIPYQTTKKESLTFKHNPRSHKTESLEAETENVLKYICENSEGLVKKEVSNSVHKLVYLIRGLSTSSLEKIYNSLKSKQLCSSGKSMRIFLDALRSASSGGSIGLLTKLVKSGEYPIASTLVWMTLLPLTSYVEEESIASALPLLEKGSARKQALLGVSAMAYKYCSTQDNCDNVKAIQDLSAKLKEHLGDKCQTSNKEQETDVITALKAFGNLGYVGASADSIFECATSPTNTMAVRIAALEAFRRSPCSEEVAAKLLDIYKNRNEEDEVRIAALIALSKCASVGILKQVLKSYSSETSNQVKVFTWSYLENLRSSSDPMKSALASHLELEDIKAPSSTDITKFSRNFQISLFSELLNLGDEAEVNVIHSKSSYLPKSASLGLKSNIFGNQFDVLQVGARAEGLEHLLEKLFGPHGVMPNLEMSDVWEIIPTYYGVRKKRSADSYKPKIDALSERLAYNREQMPHGSAYFRVLGHELGWINIHKDMLQRYEEFDVEDILKNIASTNTIDVAKNLLFLDLSILFPSVTGRAYKLAGNASVTLALKLDGKVEIEKSQFPIPRINVEGVVQPSILGDFAASFSIHSENFEPGVKVETTVQAGFEMETKFEAKDGKLLHIKLKRRQDKQEIFSLKRTIFTMNHQGVTPHPQPPSYNLNYCTKYLQHFLGVRYCASATIPHFYNDQGKLKVPFVRSLQASVVAEITDSSMDGYELLIQLPDFSKREERKYKFLLDTPNSAIDRKLSIDLVAKRPNSESTMISLQTHSPFYTLDANVDIQNQANNFRLKADAVGNKKRRYSLLMDVVKDIRGARLVEYQPKISLIIPNVRPIEITGTVVCSKGRKDQITVNLQSSSFDSPLALKGNLLKEGGDLINLDADWKLMSEINVTAFSQIHRIQHVLGNEAGKGIYLNLKRHYEPDGRSYESITLEAKVENIEFRDRLQFSLESKLLSAEHQDLNSMLQWDFSLKPFAHYKNDITFRYGENFEDDRHLVRITHIFALNGDFDSFQKMDIENKLGLTISCFEFDKSVALSAVWDFVESPRFFIEAGVRTERGREISVIYDYKHLTNKPLKMQSKATFTYNDYKFLYNNNLDEIGPHEYKGHAVIEPREGKQITVDYTHKVKSQDHFHHEFDGVVNFPGNPDQMKLKADLSIAEGNAKFNGIADSGTGNPYSVDMNLQKSGPSDVALKLPHIEGSVNVNSQNGEHSVKADIKTIGRRVVVSGNVAQNDISTLNLEVLWDADRDSQKKITIEAKSNKGSEDGTEKYMITANIKYEGAINVDVTGKISTNIIRGPHYFRADFSGNMEPMAIEYTHEIKDGQLNSVAKYLRSNTEKLRLDTTGKYIFTATRVEVEYKMFLTSPYKTFDGKELYFQIMGDSSDTTRVFVTEYRIRPAPVIGYNGKLDYQRKRGFPGQIRSNLLVTVHQRPIYEGHTHVDYGNGKYSWKTSFTPLSKKKINLLTSFEHSAGFAAFHHSMAASLRYLQKVELNAVADLRNIEDAKVHSNLDINEHQLYDANSTLKVRSVVDFDGQLVILSKITPSLQLFYKAQPSGQLTKFDLNLDVDSINLITGSGELKKRKKGFNGDVAFKYKEKEFLVLNINQEAKSKNERNYLVKAKTPWRSYTASVKVNKEKKGSIKYDTKFCRNEEEMCISIDAHHKEEGDNDEWEITYKRGDIEFSIERIRVNTKEMQRFHTVIFHGDKRFGYDLRFAKEDNGHSASLGLILPSREIVMKTYVELSFRKPRVKFDFQADARKNPNRKLTTDIRFDNHIDDNNPSKLNVIITHPIYEKPIELQLIASYDSSSQTYLTAEVSADYSTDPEDKLIGKMWLRNSNDNTNHTVVFKFYHQATDEQNVDVTLKIVHAANSEERQNGVYWTWKDEGEEKQAFTESRYNENDKTFYIQYTRPNFEYRLEGAEVAPNTLLSEVQEFDLKSIYKGETTKAKLFFHFNTNCYDLHILNDAGEKARTVEVCFLGKNRNLLSIIIEGLDDEGNWVFDGSVIIVQKTWKTINFRANFNEEFLGQAVFKLTSLGEELTTTNAVGLPFVKTARFKKIMASVTKKLFVPSMRFFIPEAARFVADIRRDSAFLTSKLHEYYEKLPPFTQVKETVQKVRLAIRAVLREVWEILADYYKEYFKTVILAAEKALGFAKAICNNNEDCKAFVDAYNERGLKGICDQLKVFIQSLPDKIRAFMNRPGRDMRKVYDKIMTLVKAALQPLTKYKCGEIIVKIVQLSYQKAEPHIQSFLENYPGYYRTARQAIVTNEYVIQAAKMTKETYFMVKDRVTNIDYKKIYESAKKRVEDYLLSLSPPSAKSAITVNSLEHGVADIDLHLGISQSYVGRVVSRITYILERILLRLIFVSSQHGRTSLLVNIKRGANLDFFPPYEAQAMIIGNDHFVTFDKVFYDFGGECAYLLTRDFEDGNFTFILKPKEGDKDPSILAMIKDMKIELNIGDNMVKVDENAVELPHLTKDVVLSRSGSTIVIDDKHGVKVKCNLAHQICAFSVTGWYFGKTAGLLGTYNYESYDEFKRPKGQIANTATVHAKSWELKKGCKSNNLVPDIKINENADYYKICKAHFKDTASPLSACFYEVDPKEHLQLCARHLARANDKNKALCDIAAAYVMECENNYIELSLPNKCLTCTAPDGSTLEHGDRKKYENLKKKSADVVFIIEDHSCNKVIINDLGNLAKSIDRELQNDGFKDTMYGVVGYGGEVGNPQIYTVKGKTFYSARDMSDIAGRMKMESKKVESSRAFEAMKLAVTYSFRSDTAKSFVLLSCSPCKYDYKSLLYPVVQQILLERGVTLHVVHNAPITIRKKEKDIIGVDPDTVYHSKDFTQKDLTGEPSLRSQVYLPKDLCIALSQDVSGSFFSTSSLSKASSNEIKNWRSVFTRKFSKAVQTFDCQYCDCTSTRDHTPNTVCQPCESKRPRLPFSVCKSCALPRTVESFLSYILQLMKQ